MTRTQAQRLVKDFLKTQGVRSEGLDARGQGAAMVERTRVVFQHSEQDGTLKVSAQVHCFRQEPEPKLLAAFQKEPLAGTTTGGGEVDYEPKARSLSLSRVYVSSPPLFHEDLRQLSLASLYWLEVVVERVAARVLPG